MTNNNILDFQTIQQQKRLDNNSTPSSDFPSPPNYAVYENSSKFTFNSEELNLLIQNSLAYINSLLEEPMMFDEYFGDEGVIWLEDSYLLTLRLIKEYSKLKPFEVILIDFTLEDFENSSTVIIDALEIQEKPYDTLSFDEKIKYNLFKRLSHEQSKHIKRFDPNYKTLDDIVPPERQNVEFKEMCLKNDNYKSIFTYHFEREFPYDISTGFSSDYQKQCKHLQGNATLFVEQLTELSELAKDIIELPKPSF